MYNFKTKNDERCSNNRVFYVFDIWGKEWGEEDEVELGKEGIVKVRFFYNVAAKMQFSYTIYQNTPQMEFNIEIS